MLSTLDSKPCDLHVSLDRAPQALACARPEIWHSLEVEDGPSDNFRASLSVPTTWGNVRARGPWVGTKIEAEQHVAMEVCCLLGQSGDLLDEEIKNGTNGKLVAELNDTCSVSETCMEYRIRSAPRCLRLPRGPLNDCFHIHMLDISINTCGHTQRTNSNGACTSLAILLPMSLNFPFMVYPPGGQVSGCLKCIHREPLHLSDCELEELATWSFRILTLFQIPMPHLSRLLNLDLKPLELNHATGEFSVGSFLRGPPNARFPPDEPYSIVAPLNAMRTGIDWEFIRCSLPGLSTGDFPELVMESQVDGNNLSDDRNSKIHTMVISGHGRGQKKTNRMRRQFFTDLEIVRSDDQDIGSLPFGIELHGSVVHRSFALAGGDQAPRPGQSDSGYVVDISSCKVIPLTSYLAREVLLLPAILWQVELFLGIEEFRMDCVDLQPPVHVDKKLLRIAMTRLGVEVGLQNDCCATEIPAGDNAERLEFLGDALLKFVSRWGMFVEQPMASEGDLTEGADRFVKNAFLRQVTERMGIGDRILGRNFNRRVSGLAELRRQLVPWKAQADTMEAFIAAAWLTARSSEGQKWESSCSVLTGLFRNHLKQDQCFDYSYRDMLTDHQLPGITSNAIDSECIRVPERGSLKHYIERLEFLGDAVLQAIVSEHLFFILPDVDEGHLHFARVWLLGNSYLARCASNRLSGEREGGLEAKRLGSILPHLPGDKSAAHTFVASRNWRGEPAADFLEVASGGDLGPKCLGDLYEVMVAGYFISSRGCLDTVWKEIKSDFDIPADIIKSKVRDHMKTLGAYTEKCLENSMHPPLANAIREVNHSVVTIDKNAKCELNELVTRALGRPVKGDVIYEIISPPSSQFQVAVKLPAMYGNGPSSFVGETCRKVKEAEQSAARVALSQLMTAAHVKDETAGMPGIDERTVVGRNMSELAFADRVKDIECTGCIDRSAHVEGARDKLINSSKTSKCILNELVMQRVGHALQKGDIAYEHLGGQGGFFTAKVRLVVLEQGAPLEFRGEACRKKKDAEESAASCAIAKMKEP